MNEQRHARRRALGPMGASDTWERSRAAIEKAQQAIRRSEALGEHMDRIAVPLPAVRRERAAAWPRSSRDGSREMPLWLRRAV